jgi:hypothetical protein
MLVVVEATSGNGGDRLAPLIDEHGRTNVALNPFRLRSCRRGDSPRPATVLRGIAPRLGRRAGDMLACHQNGVLG